MRFGLLLSPLARFPRSTVNPVGINSSTAAITTAQDGALPSFGTSGEAQYAGPL